MSSEHRIDEAIVWIWLPDATQPDGAVKCYTHCQNFTFTPTCTD
jgi:hypothetical protein